MLKYNQSINKMRFSKYTKVCCTETGPVTFDILRCILKYKKITDPNLIYFLTIKYGQELTVDYLQMNKFPSHRGKGQIN